jgi:hypothetical protein
VGDKGSVAKTKALAGRLSWGEGKHHAPSIRTLPPVIVPGPTRYLLGGKFIPPPEYGRVMEMSGSIGLTKSCPRAVINVEIVPAEVVKISTVEMSLGLLTGMTLGWRCMKSE